jgi:hypothetical protein
MPPPSPMSSSSISNSNLRFLAALIVGLGVVLSADHWLYARQGFLRLFGPGTQEGQVLHKVEIADRFAPVADVIMFGSSMTRSGISSQPFLEQHIVPLNLGVSGGGPLFAYKALARIEPLLAKRSHPPTLVLEVNPDGFLLGKWDEYPQFISLERSRFAVFRDFPSLLSHFRDARLGSRLFNGWWLPSSYYRAFREQVFTGTSFPGSFFYEEDIAGYAPVPNMARASSGPFGTQFAEPALSGYKRSALEYAVRWLEIAARLNAKVVIHLAPAYFSSADEAKNLLAFFRTQFPLINFIVLDPRDIGLTAREAFDAHPNESGARMIALNLIHAAALRPNPRFGEAMAQAAPSARLPPTELAAASP